MNKLPCDFPWGSTRYADSQLYHTEFLRSLTPQNLKLDESWSAQDVGQYYYSCKDEFKGICPEVLALNVDFITDLEFDPLTNEVTDTPIADFLGFKYTRFGHKAKPNLIAARFGEWQLKIFGEDADAWLTAYGPQIGAFEGAKRTGRYLAPKGIGDIPYLPNIPTAIASKVVAKYCTPLAQLEWETRANAGLDFWTFFLEHPEIPLVIAEGAKKSLAAISQGHIALALFGVNCGVTDLTVKPELFPYVANREVIIAFDRDSKKETQHKVFKATKRLGNALTYHAKSKVRIMTWDGKQGKGLDDLIANDPELFHTAIDAAIFFEKWKLGQYTDLSGYVSKRVNVRYLGAESDPPENAQLIFNNSGKGTGKTEKLAQAAAIARQAGREVLNITHREQLGQEQSRRLGIPYRSELKDKTTTSAFGYSLCIDSLHPKANPAFNADEWEDCDLFIDEIEQVIWHLLNSPTCQQNRVAILHTFSKLVNKVIANGGRIRCCDADLTRRSIDYIVGLLEEPIKPWVLVNDYQRETKRRAYTYETPESLLSDAMTALKNGDHLLIHSGSQKVSSTWGTINLESLIKTAFPDLKILRIDRESVTTPGHPAYGCMDNLNQILLNYNVVIASPTLETGVSIDIKGHFNRVFCFATGSQTIEAVGQAIERLREDIPRHIWIMMHSSQRIGNGSNEPFSLVKSQQKVFKRNFSLLSQADAIAAFDDNFPQHLKTWATFAACHNYGFKNYRENFYELLKENGYQLFEADKPDDAKDCGEYMKALKDHNQELHYQAISEAPVLTDTEYNLIKEKRAKTDQERLAETKTAIAHRYATNEVTPDLVRADDKGFYGQLQLHYFLTIGNQFLKDRDTKKTEKLAQDGKVFIPDYNRVVLSSKVKVLELLKIKDLFLIGDRVHTAESLAEWFNELVLPCRKDIKDFIGQTINPEKDTAIGAAQRILGMMGLQMTCIGQRRVEGKRIREYQLTDINPDDRAAIFARWFERDPLSVTPPFKQINQGDMCQDIAA